MEIGCAHRIQNDVSGSSKYRYTRLERRDTKGRTAGREENARSRNKNAMFDMVIYPLGGDLS